MLMLPPTIAAIKSPPEGKYDTVASSPAALKKPFSRAMTICAARFGSLAVPRATAVCANAGSTQATSPIQTRATARPIFFNPVRIKLRSA
jgi:hypothetical protein